jgi:hypothetical protein
MINIHQINAELSKTSESDIRLDFYLVSKEKDCFFVVDKAECHPALSTQSWRSNYILAEAAADWSIADWLKELESMARENRSENVLK